MSTAKTPDKPALEVFAYAVGWDAKGENDMAWTDWYYADDKVPSDWDGEAPDRVIALTDHAAATAELQRLQAEVDHLTHQVITCGVAATHPDRTLTAQGAYADKWDSPQHQSVRALRARAEAAEAENARLREALEMANAQAERFEREWYLRGDALERIERWADAYPVSVFREPDLPRAHEALQAVGMTLDAISADAIRPVIAEVAKIARSALSTASTRDTHGG